MDANRLRDALAFGREQRGVEFKGPGARDDKQHLAKVVRAMLAMANRTDGGAVVIGVKDDGKALDPVGLELVQRDSWRFDLLAEAVSAYADPFLTFDVHFVLLDEKHFVWLQVFEFELTPCICKQEYNANGKIVLRAGALYVRGSGKIESIEVPSHVEMRDVLDRAAVKHARKLLRHVDELGLLPKAPATSSPRDHYQREFNESCPQGLLAKIQTRGHWIIRIYPQDYQANRVPKLSDVEQAIGRASVSMRGWDFPNVGNEGSLRRSNWIGQDVDWDGYVECWRAHQSGGFFFAGNIRADWGTETNSSGAGPAGGRRVLPINDAVFKLTEILEFAARLASSALGAEHLFLEIEAYGLQDRELTYDPRSFGVVGKGRAENWTWHKPMVRHYLSANARPLAVDAAINLFELFNWNPDVGVIRASQEELVRPGT